MEQHIVTIGNKTIHLSLTEELDNDLNVDDMLKIDYANLMGEILTFPVILNRLGVLLAEVDDALRRQQLDWETTKSGVDKERGKAFDRAMELLKAEGVKNPTVPQCTNKAMEDATVLEKEAELKLVRNKLLDVQKDADIVKALYWSAKSKDDKITKITDKLSPKEFDSEIVEGRINGVLIKVREALIS